PDVLLRYPVESRRELDSDDRPEGMVGGQQQWAAKARSQVAKDEVLVPDRDAAHDLSEYRGRRGLVVDPVLHVLAGDVESGERDDLGGRGAVPPIERAIQVPPRPVKGVLGDQPQDRSGPL